MPFHKRWLIEGKLTTLTPLLVSSGDTITHPDLTEKDKEGNSDKFIDISAFAKDVNDQAYIPGTTIKGNLRSWAKANEISNFENLFGSQDPKSLTSVGGKAEFWNAFANNTPTIIQPPAYWLPQRLTGVVAAVSINRKTRTASKNRLFYQEFVPPGISFDLIVTGDFTSQEVEDILFVLFGFNHTTQPITLGQSTGDGWGKLSYELISIKCLEPKDVAAWITSNSSSVGYDALFPIKPDELQTLKRQALKRLDSVSSQTSITLKLKLIFDSHFLVNDPSQSGRVSEGKSAHSPLLTTANELLLPARSFRGAMRSQAEKIIRTLGNEKIACYLDNCGEKPSCDEIYGVNELQKLCLICQLFGSSGWRSPIELSDFKSEPISTDELSIQEFVAIDRFTGAGMEGMKFNVKSAYSPTLIGSISLNLTALEQLKSNGWPFGLLALLLRDLIEGDIHFGFGASKGYGSVRVKIEDVNLPGWSACPSFLKEYIQEEQWQKFTVDHVFDKSWQETTQLCVIELEDQVQY